MNEWMLGGLVFVGTIVLLGGGAWLTRVVGGGKKDTTPKV